MHTGGEEAALDVARTRGGGEAAQGSGSSWPPGPQLPRRQPQT